MKFIKIFLLFCIVGSSLGQEPFCKYPAISYKKYINWKIEDNLEKGKQLQQSITIPKFFKNKAPITLQLVSFNNNWDSSYIFINREKKQIQKLFEPMGFTKYNIITPLFITDINGDGLLDIKLIVSYMGNGIASMNVRVIYLFQTNDGKFTKISFDDKMDKNRQERDFNRDNNYEIITMTLTEYKGHSYWLFNLYDFNANKLINVNSEFDYPIMIQYLYRANYQITNKISRKQMKKFALPLPEAYLKK